MAAFLEVAKVPGDRIVFLSDRIAARVEAEQIERSPTSESLFASVENRARLRQQFGWKAIESVSNFNCYVFPCHAV
jgi:hypothetical protein